MEKCVILRKPVQLFATFANKTMLYYFTQKMHSFVHGQGKDRKQVQYITRHKSIRVFQAICHIFISQIIKGKKVFPYRIDWYFYSASVPSNIFASK